MKIIVAGPLYRNTTWTVQMTGIEVALSENVPFQTCFVVICRLGRKLQRYNSGSWMDVIHDHQYKGIVEEAVHHVGENELSIREPVPAEIMTLINGLGRSLGGPTTLSVILVEAGKRYRFCLVPISCDPNFFSIDGYAMATHAQSGVTILC
ncbi:hypothetical protein P691DRAFT_839781 [Macrolepiota fuliginosa MF-IS2]|uniref:Plastocyanin-like domain-containing protein n=1 Tax=Macrolepiota fuliginosa MF-IS2 TaxID=1400762 RepID=A0A9P5X642_9AGAR|nr:hypothetical protein P691DRAFT_839781 [Macrolepiota fuliginosa MF-IS2]